MSQEVRTDSAPQHCLSDIRIPTHPLPWDCVTILILNGNRNLFLHIFFSRSLINCPSLHILQFQVVGFDDLAQGSSPAPRTVSGDIWRHHSQGLLASRGGGQGCRSAPTTPRTPLQRMT